MGISQLAQYDPILDAWKTRTMPELGKKTTKEHIANGSIILDRIQKNKKEELERLSTIKPAKDLLSKDIIRTKEYIAIVLAINTESQNGGLGVVLHPMLQLKEELAKELIHQGYRIGQWGTVEKEEMRGIYISWEGDVDILLSESTAGIRVLHSFDNYSKFHTSAIDPDLLPF